MPNPLCAACQFNINCQHSSLSSNVYADFNTAALQGVDIGRGVEVSVGLNQVPVMVNVAVGVSVMVGVGVAAGPATNVTSST